MRISSTILDLLTVPPTGSAAPTDRAPLTDPASRTDPGRHGRRVRAASAGQLWSWRQRARCRGSDSGVFFGPRGERAPACREREEAAKAICARCPVRQPCASYALNSREPHGVWGGMSETERATILRPSSLGA